MLSLTDSQQDIERAVALLRAGELVALPTETVYGLAADATSETAVRKVFRAKQRPVDHPLIVHIAAAEALPQWATAIPEAAWRLANAFWPGPMTLVLQALPTVSRLVTGGQSTVAVRVPAHPVFQEVLRQLGRGVVAPSANPFGQISPTMAAHVRQHLAHEIAAVVDGGPCAVGIESTIVDLSGAQPRILRPGMLGPAELTPYLSELARSDASAPRVPGALLSHYAPRKPCYRIAAGFPVAPGVTGRVGLLAQAPVSWPVARFWPMPADPDEYARVLYARLHEADASDCEVLLVMLPQETPAWEGVRDRLLRASRPL